MAKYKNKDGIELSFEGHENDSHIQLIKEVVIEAIKIGDRSGYWSSNWKRIRNFLSENLSYKLSTSFLDISYLQGYFSNQTKKSQVLKKKSGIMEAGRLVLKFSIFSWLISRLEKQKSFFS